MNFLMGKTDGGPPVLPIEQRRPPDQEPAGFGETLSAAWRAETIRTDAWGDTSRRRRDLALEMFGRLDREAHQRIAARRFDHDNAWVSFEAMVLDEAGLAAARDPVAWKGLPLTAEQFDEQILAARRDDLDEAQAILDRPGGRIAEFLGTGARAMTDPISLALAPFGLSGAPLRVILGEAVLGGLGEAAVLPRERRVARELDLPDPDPASRIALGVLFAGTIAGGIVGVPRAVRYARARARGEAAARPAGVSLTEHQAALDAAEAALTDARTPPEILGGLDMRSFDYTRNGDASPTANRVGYVAGKLLELGYEPHVVAGLVGNLMQESGVQLHTRAVGDGGNAIGIGQWNGPRRRALQQFALARGKDWQDLDTQIAFLDYELKGPEADALARIAATSNAREAALVASREFWRPGVPHNARRAAFADMVDRQMAAGEVPRWSGPVTSAGDDVPAFTTSRGFTRQGQVTAGDDVRIDVAYEVVDASILERASGDLQPRDRTRAASDEQVAEIAARLDPARLMPSPEADRGAPVVGPDNIIESGNGRVMAIHRAYERHPDRAEAYRSAIEQAGFEIPEGVREPVLIARRVSELDQAGRQRFVRAANTSAVARMSATERSAADAATIDRETIALYHPGRPLNAPENRRFVTRALAAMPQAERNALVDASGALNADGVRRLQQGLFARAYAAPDIIARYAEADAGELRSLMDALEAAAPEWAAMRAAVAAGELRPDADITAFVIDAMRLIANARSLAGREGIATSQAVADLVDEIDLLEGAISPLTAALVRKFWHDGRAASADDVADFLKRYANEARRVASAEAGLFGEAPGPVEILKAIDREHFGDLPDDLGRPRAVGTSAPADAGAVLDGDAFAEGASSPVAEAADRAALDELQAATRPTAEIVDEILAAERLVVRLADYPPDVARALDARLRAQQNIKSVDDLIARAGPNNDALKAATAEIADRLGIGVKKAPAKKRARIEEKVRDKYAGRIERITDAARSTILVRTADDAEQAIAALAERFDIVDEGWSVRPEAYFDRTVTVRFEDGQLGEVQIMPFEMDRAKNALGGHKLYVVARTLTVPEAERQAAMEKMLALYSEAAASVDESFSDLLKSIEPPASATARANSASDTSGDLSSPSTSAATMSRHLPSVSSNRMVPGDGSTAGMEPSTRKNRISSTSTADIGARGAEINDLAAARAAFADLEIELPDGSKVSARDIIDDIEADEDLVGVIDACTLGGARNG